MLERTAERRAFRRIEDAELAALLPPPAAGDAPVAADPPAATDS